MPELISAGNYYSLRAEHEKAVKYFRRATQLDRTYLSAWTLMGHEYVEMKNSHAAIEAYRRAVGMGVELVFFCFFLAEILTIQMLIERITELGMALAKLMNFSVCIIMHYIIINMPLLSGLEVFHDNIGHY